MGYESRLIIGQLGTRTEGEDLIYFLKMTSLDLCKCGYDSEIYNIGTAVNSRNKPVPTKYKDIEAVQVYWSQSFSVRQEKVIEQISKTAEDWETNITEDNYGDKLIAIPLPIILDALKRDNATALLEDGSTYRRFDIAIAMVESLLKAFPEHEVEEGEYNGNLYCVLWGY